MDCSGCCGRGDERRLPFLLSPNSPSIRLKSLPHSSPFLPSVIFVSPSPLRIEGMGWEKAEEEREWEMSEGLRWKGRA
ncbi:hypothetical protein CLOP_g19298 [Closterium sp. NIES-67]|nr:hypothetical protein CLOP_g19298 [Closterium sp. NIES-67]